MDRLAVGVDGSTASRAALRWAAALAAGVGSEVVAVNAWSPDAGDAEHPPFDRPLDERRSAIEQGWGSPASELGVELRGIVGAGDPRQVVLPLAEADGAELLVLGRTGSSGGPGFLHLGSLVEYVAHHTSLPLAAIPAGSSERFDRIAVGVDGSSESLHALAWVADIAPKLGSTVVAVQVEEPFLEWTPVSSPDNWRRGVERQLEEWTEPLRSDGVPVEVVAKRDLRPVDGLLGAATGRHADLLVVGTRGRGGFTGLRAGGVALQVLHRADLPVVLVPPS